MASGGSGVKGDAFGSYGNATGQANNAFNVANPIYTQEATHPIGYTPQQTADLKTASADSLGGSNASAVGQGALLDARTNNAGGADAAISQTARQAGQVQADNSLNIQNQGDALAREQQQEGLHGLNGIYNTGTQSGENYLNLANQAKPTFWQQLGSQAAFSALKAAQSAGGGE